MTDVNRLALVTGASKGVGRGIALGLAAVGWDVAVNYHGDELGAQETCRRVETLGRQAWTFQADVGDEQQVKRMFADLADQTGRPLAALVNNAGQQTWSPLLELSVSDWERTLRTNVTGAFLCTQEAARRMRDQGGGAIVNIGSGSNKHPFPNLVDYTTSKGALQNFTVVSAVELGPDKIRVNCVAPGAIEIERTQHEAPDYAETWGPITPLRRVGQVEDVARAVRFLVSKEADFITGQTLYVDGGLFSQCHWPYPS